MVKRAICSARLFMIGTGHMATVGALKVNKPMSTDLGSGKFMAGKSVMWAPFMEDIVRIINPDYFEERFNMGSPWAERLRSVRRINYLQTKGYGPAKDIKK